MKITVAGSLGLLVGSLVAGPALADSQYSIAVKQADFRSAESVRALHKRIRREARNACPDYSVERNLREISICRQEVEADLVNKIDHPLLNAFVEGDESLRIALAARRAGADRS